MSPTALVIAGFDPSSGAGVTADLLTFAAHGIFATSAVTALTVQNTLGVRRVQPVDPHLLGETLAALEADLPPDGIKIGMLGRAALVDVVAAYLESVRKKRPVQVVLDPVLRSSSGADLLLTRDRAAASALDPLLEHVDAVTPNLAEASLLTGLPCGTEEEMEACARHLVEQYPALNVVVTGGHLPQPSDLLLHAAEARWLRGQQVQSSSTHGTGCAFSTALLSARLLGKSWPEATASAKHFVHRGMQSAVPRGAGRGPLALLPQLEADYKL